MMGSASACCVSCSWLTWLLAALLVGCSSSGAAIEESRSFTDAQGRQCEAQLSRASAHAPAVSKAVSCSGDGRQCSSDSSPCFELSMADQTEGYTLRNCPACCLGTASSFVSSDCSPVACQTDSDCVFAKAQCSSGSCACPNGLCD